MLAALFLLTTALAQPAPDDDEMPGDAEMAAAVATIHEIRGLVRSSGNQGLNSEVNRRLRRLERELGLIDELRFHLLGHAALIEGELAMCQRALPERPPPRYRSHRPQDWRQAHEAAEPAPPPPEPATSEELRRIRQAVDAGQFSNAKLDALRSAARDRNFTAAQVREIMDWFSFGRDKIEAAAMLHGRVIDHQNWFEVYEALNFPADKRTLQQRVGDE